MKREELQALGVKEEIISEIMAMHGRDVQRHKQEAKQQEELAAQLLAQIEKASEQLKDYEPDWKTRVHNAQSEAKAQMDSIRLNAALDKALINANVRDEIAVKAHLNLQEFENTCEGLLADELASKLSDIKSTHSFLFCDAPEFAEFAATPGAQKTSAKSTDEANSAIRAFFSK